MFPGPLQMNLAVLQHRQTHLESFQISGFSEMDCKDPGQLFYPFHLGAFPHLRVGAVQQNYGLDDCNPDPVPSCEVHPISGCPNR